MPSDNPIPTPRYRIKFKGHAQTWEGLERIIRQMQNDVERQRTPGPRQIASGSGYTLEITEPDPTQTEERYEQELSAWCERTRKIRRKERADA